MVLDQVENFVRVSVLGGHTAGETTISLESGEASLLPDVTQGKYNLIWWDSENFSLPSEDPSVEIVRVNSINTSNDTISVTRGQENTSAASKNDTTGEYSLILGPTAKTITDIDSTKLDASAYSPEADTHARYTDSEALDAINGSVIEPEQAIHSRSIDNNLTLSSDQGLVLAGPVSGSGSISGDGSFVVTDNSLGESEVINLIQSQNIDADTLDGFDASQLGIDVSNNASTIVSNATDINFGSGLTAADDSDGTSTVSISTDHASSVPHDYFSGSHNDLTNIGSSDHHTRYTDSEASNAAPVQSVNGETGNISISGFSGSHNDLTDIGSSDHHTRYSDSEAISAINSEASLSVDISGDADTVGGFDVQENGTDGQGIINFVTGSASIDADTLGGVSPSGYSPSSEPFSSHLTSTQSNAENGFNVNIFDSVDISSSSITKDSSSQISFNEAGVYSISWMVNFHRTGSGSRNIMYSEIELNNNYLSSRSRVADYIRNDGNGDECSTGNTVFLSISSGDTLKIYANQERGGESGNDIERAFINISKIE